MATGNSLALVLAKDKNCFRITRVFRPDSRRILKSENVFAAHRLWEDAD